MLEPLKDPQKKEELLTSGLRDEDYFNKSPLCRKLHALIECADFVSNITWIAKRLGETESAVRTALSVLVNVGATSIDNGTISNSVEQVSMKPNSKDFLVDCHRVSSLEVLSGIDTESRFTVYHGYQATDTETFWEFNKKLQELQSWFIEASKTSKKDLLLGYTLTGANLLKDSEGGSND